MSTAKSEYNLSFAGCGFLGLYHAGVCGCIQEFAPYLYKGRKVSGTSAGAIAAAFLVCDVKLSDCVHYLMQTINTARSYYLGPFDPRFKITQHLREGLELYLPEDAHIRCSGNLHISMTNQATNENYIAKNYKDRNELIKAILCSSYIPVFSGFIPLTFRGEWMIDGALTKNTLELDGNTITISPFSGDADICPRDDCGYGQIYLAGTSFLVNSENFQRMLNIIWPKSPEELGKLTQLGYSDALHFLARKELIKCNLHQCHTIFLKVKVNSQQRITDENCKKCRQNIKAALKSVLPNKILSCFMKANQTTESQLIRYLRLLSHAATLPILVLLKIINRFVTLLKASPRHMIGSLLDVIRTLTSLDDIFKKALSNAIECNHKHGYLCDALEKLHLTYEIDNKICSDDEESGYSESEESLFENSDSDMFTPINVANQERESFQKQLEEFGGVLEDINVESFTDVDISHRPDIPGCEDAKTMTMVTVRGEADGKDSDGSFIDCQRDLRLDLDHQMTWSYPNISNTSEISYYILAPILDSRLNKSSQSL